MKNSIKTLALAIITLLTIGCTRESYAPVDDVTPMETYMITTPEYGEPIFKNEVYKMYLYKDLDKVSVFLGTNESNVSIYKIRNRKENITEHEGKDIQGRYAKYKKYDIKFDLIKTDKEGKETSFDTYHIISDMNPTPTVGDDGVSRYGTRKLTRWVGGENSGAKPQVSAQLSEVVEKIRLMSPADLAIYK